MPRDAENAPVQELNLGSTENELPCALQVRDAMIGVLGGPRSPRRRLRVEVLPLRRTVIQFIYPERPEGERNWWIVVDPQSGADLCAIEPGFDVDLFVRTDLRTMTAIWMGMDTMPRAIADDRLTLIGDPDLQKKMAGWLGLSTFAVVEKQVA